MAQKDTLRTYRQKRRFDRTAEPAGGRKKKRASKNPLFVIQKHNATT